MLTPSQSEKIARKCTAVVLRALDKFQGYLDESDPESAAHIVADLMKTQVTGVLEPNPEDEINKIIKLAQTGAYND